MPRPRNEALMIAQRRARVAELYLQGKYQWEIGAAVGVDHTTVSRDLAAIRALWKASAVRDFDEAKEKELARIDALEREYWAAWEESKREKESTQTEKTTGGVGGDRLKAGVKKEVRDGNPSFLSGVQWCINKRCEILGFDAPKNLNVKGSVQDSLLLTLEQAIAADKELENWQYGRDGKATPESDSDPAVDGSPQVPP